MTDTSAPAPIRREIRVACDPTTAFELFTAHLGAWWPLAAHSVFGEEASVAFEDGAVVERLGTEQAVWGSVVEWDRPTGFRMTWHPGQDPEGATDVAVSFGRDGDGTLVTLVHSGWERLAEPESARAEYDRGWPTVLGGFAARVGGERRDGGDRRDDGDRREGADRREGEPPKSQWFALHHRPGPALRDGGSVFAHPLFGEHVAFLGRLRERGWLVAAGPVEAATGSGMTVVRVPAEEGDALDASLVELATQDDQAVARGLLTVEVQPWDVRFTAAP